MPTRRYTVVLSSDGHYVIARLGELGISTVGASVPEALANVRKRALVVMGEFEGSYRVPVPNEKMLAAIELPLPSTSRPHRRRGCHLRILEDAGVGGV